MKITRVHVGEPFYSIKRLQTIEWLQECLKSYKKQLFAMKWLAIKWMHKLPQIYQCQNHELLKRVCPTKWMVILTRGIQEIYILDGEWGLGPCGKPKILEAPLWLEMVDRLWGQSGAAAAKWFESGFWGLEIHFIETSWDFYPRLTQWIWGNDICKYMQQTARIKLHHVATIYLLYIFNPCRN